MASANGQQSTSVMSQETSGNVYATKKYKMFYDLTEKKALVSSFAKRDTANRMNT